MMKYTGIIGLLLCASPLLAQTGHEGHNHTTEGLPEGAGVTDEHAGHQHRPGDQEAIDFEREQQKEATVNSDTLITIGNITRPAKKYYGNGKLKEESYYLDGQERAVTNWYYMDGNISAVYHYRNGKIDGLQKAYYFNNKLKSQGYWSNDLQHGIYREYYENGTLKTQGEYKKGKKSGTWKRFAEDGLLNESVKYKNGIAQK